MVRGDFQPCGVLYMRKISIGFVLAVLDYLIMLIEAMFYQRTFYKPGICFDSNRRCFDGRSFVT